MAGFVVTAQNLLNSAPILGEIIGQGYRPPQWASPQLTSITVVLPAAHTETVSHNIDFGTETVPGTENVPATTTQHADEPQSTTYFFDAVMSIEHEQELRITEHPIQSGAALSDHAYPLPARVVLEIGMSDAMASFVAGQYSDFSSKSVSAYQKLLSIQALKIPLTVNTRLRTYQNMLMERIRVRDDVSTIHGLKVVIPFRQIMVGSASIITQSARPNTTTSTNPGASQPQAVGADIQKYLNSSGQWNSNLPVNLAQPPSN